MNKKSQSLQVSGDFLSLEIGDKKDIKPISSNKKIIELFKKAEEIIKKDLTKSRLFIKKARKIAMHYRLRIPKNLKRKYCKKCNSYLITGFNSSVRISKKSIIITCLNCKNKAKILISAKRKHK